jgi:hypothetical protein
MKYQLVIARLNDKVLLNKVPLPFQLWYLGIKSQSAEMDYDQIEPINPVY